MKVKLKHCANIDINGGYYGKAPRENNIYVEVNNLEEASETCKNWIHKYGLGSGNWIGGQVYENGKQIARISYNGRAWAIGAVGRQEIKLAKGLGVCRRVLLDKGCSPTIADMITNETSE